MNEDIQEIRIIDFDRAFEKDGCLMANIEYDIKIDNSVKTYVMSIALDRKITDTICEVAKIHIASRYELHQEPKLDQCLADPT